MIFLREICPRRVETAKFPQPSPMDRQFSNLCIVTLILLCLGTYFGNVFIGIGEGLLALTLAMAIIHYLQYRGEFQGFFKHSLSWSWICLASFVLVCILSLVVNLESYERPFKDLKKLRHLVLPLCVVALPLYTIYTRGRETSLVRLIVVFCGFSVLLVTISSLIGKWTGYHPLLLGKPQHLTRIGGIYGMVMTYAYSMQFTVCVAIGLLAFFVWNTKGGGPSKKNLFLVAGVVLVTGVGLYYSLSRGAILGVIVALVVLAFATRLKILVVLVIVGAVICAGFFLQSKTRYNFRYLKYQSVRVAQWKAASLTVLDRPLLGLGYRQFEKQGHQIKEAYGMPNDYPPQIPRIRFQGHAHNNYLEAFASTGVFGGVLLIGFMIFWFVEAWQCFITRLIYAPAIAGFAAAGCFENSFFDSEVVFVVMFHYVICQFVLKGGMADDWDNRGLLVGLKKPISI